MAAMIGATVLVSAALASAAPLAPSASFEPAAPRFADRIAATATVVVGDGVDPGSVRTVGGFGPLDVLSGPVVERHDRGGGRTAVELRWVVACLNEDCVPGDTARAIALPPLRFSATREDGSRATAVVRWPALAIAGRVSRAEAGAATPPLRRETTLPAVSYRVSPGTLATAFDALAGLLLLAAAALAVRALVRRQRRREAERLARLTPLERALLYARESEGRGPDDRRRALGLLGRVLGETGSALGGSASRLAWSPPEPSPDEVESVVGDVEHGTVG